MPAVAQDINTGEVLMLGYMNPGSLKRTVEGEQVWFYSRSREDLWHKGEVSGNYLNLREAWVDCDADTILLKVQPDGRPAIPGKFPVSTPSWKDCPTNTRQPSPAPASWMNCLP